MIDEIKQILDENITELKCKIAPYILNHEYIITSKTMKPKIYVFLCGYYQNLGDMALTYGHRVLLEKWFGDKYEIIMLPSTSTYTSVRKIKKTIAKEDIVTILGGGNMDDIYVSLENCRRHIIQSFRHNRVILFPQTMAFKEDLHGRYRLKKSIHSYNSHPDLYIFTREEKSLVLMRKHFTKAKMIDIVPDIVLSIEPQIEKMNRSGIHVAFRHDKEKRSNSPDERIISMLQDEYENVSIRDTVDISLDECTALTYEKTLYEFWEMLSQKKVVVTDRLHCMIFCVITGTPCVVFDNSNNKISGVYKKWLSHLRYIRMETAYSDEVLMKDVEEMYQLEPGYEVFSAENKFEKLHKAMVMND